MDRFVGRTVQLEQLDQEYRRAQAGRGSFVWITGRRRIGKSRLVEQFIGAVSSGHVYFQAPRGASRDPLREFVAAVSESSLPAAQLATNLRPDNWRGALELAATGGSAEHPAIIVIDEFPYLHAADDGVDADLQHSWDRVLERLPLMLVCVGSDLSMMARLLEPDRPLHGRPTLQMRVPGLNPAEVGDLADLDPAAAIDAYLVVGGFPALVREWRPGSSARSFLKRQLSDSSLPLVINGERILNAEFPVDSDARTTLSAIGSGERTFTKILQASGLPKTTLDRALKLLVGDKRVVARMRPIAVPPGKDTRYMVTDAHLRFWLRFVGPYVDELDRGRSDLVLARIERDWETFRGGSVEPVVRDALSRLLPAARYGGARDVGAYWTRANEPEIDLVGVDSLDRPQQVGFVGSIKWRERATFGSTDAATLARHRSQLPGARPDTLLVGVARNGFDAAVLDIQLGPADLLDAWH